MHGLPLRLGRLLATCGLLLFALLLAARPAAAGDSMALEFGVPFQLRLTPDRAVLEVFGSFTPQMPQDLEAVLSQNPALKIVRLESPGGRLGPALRVAALFQKHGISTYVAHYCASACTLAFLAGRQRWAAPDATVGFHRARMENGSPEQFDAANRILRESYAKFGVPDAFIAHVMQTPPEELWAPTAAELRGVHITTDNAPPALLALGGGDAPRFGDMRALLRTAPGDMMVQFARALTEMVLRLQSVNPEACWSFAHEGHGNELKALPRADLEAMAAAMKDLRIAARYQQAIPLDDGQRKAAMQDLIGSIRANGQEMLLEGLRQGADHTRFCPSFAVLMQAALSLPYDRRVLAVRALLASK
jgi:hypothetical protein